MNYNPESPAVGRGVMILQDDDEDIHDENPPPSNRSTGGTPLGRSSSSMLTSPLTSRNVTPRPRSISYEDLASRPRSNPRSRTPMRYESPLNANAFVRTTTTVASSPSQRQHQRHEGQRVTVRPLAGLAVGTTLLTRRIQEEQGATTTILPAGSMRSSKQGPSHRKINRWNRDNFVGLASHLAKHAGRTGTAEAVLLAQADAPRYRSIYNPLRDEDHPSAVSMFNQDEKLEQVRHQFFEGEIGHGVAPSREPQAKQQEAASVTRIHERLRNVIVRACTSSTVTVAQVDALEACLTDCFHLETDWDTSSSSLLLEEAGVDTLLNDGPVVTSNTNRLNRATAKFYFNAASASGGFHRLLLHALCQFHGLAATSRTTMESKNRTARLLTVTGKRFTPTMKLTDCIRLELALADALEEATSTMPAPDVHQLKTGLAATIINA